MKVYELNYNEKTQSYEEHLIEPIKEQRLICSSENLLKYPWELIAQPKYITHIDESISPKSEIRKKMDRSCFFKVLKLAFGLIFQIKPLNLISDYFKDKKVIKEKICFDKKIQATYELNYGLYFKYKEVIGDLRRFYFSTDIDDREKLRLYKSFTAIYNLTHDTMIRSYHLELKLIEAFN